MPELPDSSGGSIKLKANCVFENDSQALSDLVTSHIFTRFSCACLRPCHLMESVGLVGLGYPRLLKLNLSRVE